MSLLGLHCVMLKSKKVLVPGRPTKSKRTHGRCPEAKVNLVRQSLIEYTIKIILASLEEAEAGLRSQ